MSRSDDMVGVLLAAGAGRRRGEPKALAVDARGSWLLRSVAVLFEGGCAEVVVVLGASADEAQKLLPVASGLRVIRADDWATGLSASLRAGLEAAQISPHQRAVMHLVDLPDVTGEVVARVAGAASGPTALARAVYAAVPGHPVVFGRDHWAGVADATGGDRGARDYLAAREVTLIECGDLASGADSDL